MAITPIPRKASWEERNGNRMEGLVIKEIQEVESYEWGDFCRVIQIIKKKGESEDLIRFGYYVKDKGSSDDDYSWGSQTAFISKRSTFNKLIEKAKKEGLF